MGLRFPDRLGDLRERRDLSRGARGPAHAENVFQWLHPKCHRLPVVELFQI